MIKKLFAASLAIISVSANASLIDFTASGDGNIASGWNEGLDHADFTGDPAANFFKIVFSQGQAGESITELSFDLRAGSDSNAFFDPSDAKLAEDINGGGMGFGPIIGNGTVGLLSSDVIFSLDALSGTNPILSIMFSAGSFMDGDILSFGIDIDHLDGQLTDIGGGLLGLHSVGIEATIGGSCEAGGATAFKQVNRNTSEAQLELCTPLSSTSANVPVPGSIFLLIIGLLALRQQKKLAPEKNTINVLA